MMSKSTLMHFISCGLAHESFTHEIYGTFDITEIRRDCLDGKFGDPVKYPWFPVQKNVYEFLRANRDFEESRIQHFVNLGAKVVFGDPIINVKIPASEHDDVISGALTEGAEFDKSRPWDLFIDGIHRLSALWRLKYPCVQVYEVLLAQAKRPAENFGPVLGLDWGEENYLEKRGIKR